MQQQPSSWLRHCSWKPSADYANLTIFNPPTDNLTEELCCSLKFLFFDTPLAYFLLMWLSGQQQSGQQGQHQHQQSRVFKSVSIYEYGESLESQITLNTLFMI